MYVKLLVKEAIIARGMTQAQLAEITDIRPAAISMLVRNYVERLNLDHIARIAEKLNIEDIRELITLENK